MFTFSSHRPSAFVLVGKSTKEGSKGMTVRIIGPFFDEREIDQFVEEMNKLDGMKWRKVNEITYIDDERGRRYDVECLNFPSTYLRK